MLFLRPKKNSPLFACVVQPAGSDANWKRSHLRPRLPLVMSQREKMLVTYSAFVSALPSLCVEVDPTKCSFFGRRQIHFNFVWEAANRGLRAPFVSRFSLATPAEDDGVAKGESGTLKSSDHERHFVFHPVFSVFFRDSLEVSERCRRDATHDHQTHFLYVLYPLNSLFCLSQNVHMATAGDSVSNQTQLCKVWTIYM